MLNNMSVCAKYPPPALREDENLQDNDNDSPTGTTSYNHQPTEFVQLTVQNDSESLTENYNYQNLQDKNTCYQAQSNVYERIHHCGLPVEIMPHALKKICKNDPPPRAVMQCDLPIEFLCRQVLKCNEI